MGWSVHAGRCFAKNALSSVVCVAPVSTNSSHGTPFNTAHTVASPVSGWTVSGTSSALAVTAFGRKSASCAPATAAATHNATQNQTRMVSSLSDETT